MGLGPAAPKHRDGRDQRGPWTDEPDPEAVQADDLRTARLVNRLLRLGGDIPADRWERLDRRIDRLLRGKLSPRDLVRIGQLQVGRERVVAAATGKLLDKLAADPHQVAGPSGPVTVEIVYVDDFYGTAAAAESADASRMGDDTKKPLEDLNQSRPAS